MGRLLLRRPFFMDNYCQSIGDENDSAILLDRSCEEQGS
jgi:hypothetical protein